MVPITNKQKIIFCVAILILAVLLFSRGYVKELLFYNQTKNLPFIPSAGSNLQQSSTTTEFQVVVRQNDQGELFAVWDSENFKVWSVGLFEIPEIANIGQTPEPAFLIRSFFRDNKGQRISLKLLSSPYKIGETKDGFEVVGGLQLVSAKKYILQALRVLNPENLSEGIRTSESRYVFTYEKKVQE